MKNYKTITELYEGFLNEDFHPEDLSIQIDNDVTYFYSKSGAFKMTDGEGYQDILKAFSLLFPLAKVDWI